MFEQYINDAIRTESLIDEVTTDVSQLFEIATAFISAGNLLDAHKKNIFYGKPFDDSYNFHVNNLYTSAYDISDLYDNQSPDLNTINVDPRVVHGIVGISTESTELMEALVTSVLTNSEIDKVNVQEEIFDTMWYIFILCDALKIDLEEAIELGFKKLKSRYPEKFSSDSAINRDVDIERKILEGLSDEII